MAKNSYNMIIERKIVDKLGLKLYDKISAVVSELIANSYDADAEEVNVILPLGKMLAKKKEGKIEDYNYEIKVIDNGHGMTPDQANSLFLRVGKEKWIKKGEDESRDKHRKVMGRKGIGKLSPFGVCKTIEVRSAGGKETEKGYEVSHFRINYDDIIKETSEKDPNYHPKPLEDDRTWDAKTGTIITLKNFLPRIVPNGNIFHKQLSYRFGLSLPDFKIFVEDNKRENPEKRFTLGEYEIPFLQNTKIVVDEIPVELEDGTKLSVKGWIALAKESYKVDDIAGVRIYVRGKIASVTRDFGLPAGFSGEFVARSYLIGEVHADWLDEEDEDLIQTSRQDILWSSEYGQAFAKWGAKIIKDVAKAGREPHRARTREKFLEISNLSEKAGVRYKNQKDLVNTALELGKTIGSFAAEDQFKDEDYIENLTEIILTLAPHKLWVEAFKEIEKMAVDGKIEIEKLKEIFDTTNIAQLASLGQIVFEKIKVIDLLQEKIRTNGTTEPDLQKILEGAPWLIDSSWECLTKNKTLKTFRSAFEAWYKKEYNEEILTSTEVPNQAKRPDFILLHIGNSIRVVEIKSPGHEFNDVDWDRFERYDEASKKFLSANEGFLKDFPDGINYIIISDGVSLSHTRKLAFESLKQNRKLENYSWEVFLRNTKNTHQTFIDARDSILF